MSDPANIFIWIGNHYLYLLAFAALVILLWNSIVIVGGNEVALVRQ